jgi:hypothetical protein
MEDYPRDLLEGEVRFSTEALPWVSASVPLARGFPLPALQRSKELAEG